MKIAITGHSSGLGNELHDIIDLTMPGIETRGYSKSNGWNIAEQEGEKVIADILDFDPDVFFNNAYYPAIQNRILDRLYNEWKDQDKVIINTGSISGYLAPIIGDEPDYVRDKKALAEYCILNSFNYKINNRCRIQCISFGFVDTPLLNLKKEDATKNMIPVNEAAFLLLDTALDEKTYLVPEMVVNPIQNDDVMLKYYKIATKNMLKHVARSNRDLKSK